MIKKELITQQTRDLMEGLLCLKNMEECQAFLEDLCTVSEIQSLAQRFEVARMLMDKATYQEVVKKTGASTATISRVNRCLNYGTDGYELVIGRLEEKKRTEEPE